MSINKLPEILVEQMFSLTGIPQNQKCSLIAPRRANVVFFIRGNYSQFFPLSCHQSTEKIIV